jgi:hypothetical protein
MTDLNGENVVASALERWLATLAIIGAIIAAIVLSDLVQMLRQ